MSFLWFGWLEILGIPRYHQVLLPFFQDSTPAPWGDTKILVLRPQDRVLDWEEVYASQTKKRTLAEETQKESSSYMFYMELEHFKGGNGKTKRIQYVYWHIYTKPYPCARMFMYIYLLMYSVIWVLLPFWIYDGLVTWYGKIGKLQRFMCWNDVLVGRRLVHSLGDLDHCLVDASGPKAWLI